MRLGLAFYGIAYIALCLALSGGDDNTLENSGMAAFRIRDFSSAERTFLRLIATKPSAHSWKLLGMSYAAEEKYSLAAPAFERACALDNKEIMACYYLGRTQLTVMGVPSSSTHSDRVQLSTKALVAA